ncbi:MAG: 4-hydroxybutyrate CoA-transferase [Acidimicrobiia bacterium]|jgi:acyl-CoA hydrolase|nr:4-hydroxybutyrate CoA-transferase [Acidimicrobiia bacterium]
MARPLKFASYEEATALVRDVDTFAIPLGPGIPSEFLHQLGAREAFTDLEVFGALLIDLFPLFTRPGVRLRSGFFGPAERILRDGGANVEFAPADFRRFRPILERLNPRVMATAATPPDADGWMSLSLHAGATVGALHQCGADPERVLIVEVNDAMPRTFGLGEHRHAIHVDEADAIVRSERPPFLLGDKEPTDVDKTIAQYAAGFIESGATLQTGIGGIPSTVAALLAERDGGGYGIHSEMFTTGLMKLHKAGKVTNSAKGGAFEGYSVTTFAAGTAELYEWLDENHEVAFLPVDLVNAPELIAANNHMVTINGALSIDLAGQVVADSVIGKQFSGIGGHEDFLSGPGLELEDRSLLCLPSTHRLEDGVASRIVGRLPSGSIVSTPRHQIDVVITEFGAVELEGRTVRERARLIASIAAPEFRDQLLAEAEVWPAG